MQIDPYSNEVRYPLALAASCLAAARPRSVRIASRSPEMVKAVVRTLLCHDWAITVESDELKELIRDTLGVEVGARRTELPPADAVVLPFSLEEGMEPAGESFVVAVCYNALSYKALLGARHMRGTVFRKAARLRRTHRVRPIAGVFPPVLGVYMALLRMVEPFSSALYFQLQDRLMRRLVEWGPMTRLSYIVLLAGQRTN